MSSKYFFVLNSKEKKGEADHFAVVGAPKSKKLVDQYI